MKTNPRPEWSNAPVYLPDSAEVTMEPERYPREMRWMAWAFWQLADKNEDLRSQIKACDLDASESYTEGYTDGASDVRREFSNRG